MFQVREEVVAWNCNCHDIVKYPDSLVVRLVTPEAKQISFSPTNYPTNYLFSFLGLGITTLGNGDEK